VYGFVHAWGIPKNTPTTISLRLQINPSSLINAWSLDGAFSIPGLHYQ
jgi:hypothetical protein